MASLSAVLLLLFGALLISAETCKDHSTICDLLMRFCGHKRHGEWMERYCAATCGLCDGKIEAKTTTTTTTAIPTTTEAMTPPVTNKPETPEPIIPGACGLPQIKGSRIVGGKKAVPGSWPWQILMLYNGYPGCGGSLISAEWVLSAAHCVFGLEEYTSSFTIRTGEYNRAILEGTEQEYDVEKIITHPDYDPRKLNNDIALLKLKSPVMFDKYRAPVCLPSLPPKVGDNCTITGWGKMKYTEHMVNILQQGKLQVVDQKTCHKLNMKNIRIPVTKAMVCGGSGGSSILSGCHGDSGGPYVCQDGGRWILQGAVSHGSPRCNSTETYTVFSKVFYFRPWIDTTMRTV